METAITYTQRLRRIESIISSINSGTVDPSDMIKLIAEAQTLIKQCSEELTTLEQSIEPQKD